MQIGRAAPSTLGRERRIRVGMVSRGVPLHVGGQTYRVTASVDEAELRRLAEVVDDKIMALTPPGRPVAAQAILLAAITLAHEAEEQRRRADALAERTRDLCGRILTRVDAVLGPIEAAAARPDGAAANDAGASAPRS